MANRQTLRFLLNLEFIAPRAKVLGAICLSYVIELLFTLVEFKDSVPKKWHPFYQGHVYDNGERWDGRVTEVVFYYGFLEMLARATIFLATYWAVIHRLPLRIFLLCCSLELVDMADYWLFRNDPWFGTWFEFNYLKILCIFVYAWIEYSIFLPKSTW